MSEQFKTWDYYYSLVRSSNHLSSSLKKDAINALNILKTFFGEEWFSTTSIKKHPLFWDLRGIEADGNLSNILTLAKAISNLKNVKGFDRLFWKLKNNKDYYSTFSELEIAHCIKQKKTSIEIEPHINGKNPDILCKYKGKQLFLEIKSLGRAERTFKATITVASLSSHTEIPIFPCGKVLKIMEGKELQNVKEEVIKTCRKSIETNSPMECFIPEKVKFYFVPSEIPVKKRVQLYQKWCDEQEFYDSHSMGQKGGLLFPDDKVSQEKRIATRLKQIRIEKQLPSDKPSIVCFDSNQFYFWFKEEIKRYLTFLQNELKKYPFLVAIVLQTKIIGEESRKGIFVRSKKYYSLITSYPFGILQKDKLIIKNLNSKFDVDFRLITELFMN